jgi:hypothetical protein
MALKKVVLYFEDQQDALRFTLAAGSLISGEYSGMTGPLAKLTAPLSRAARITAGGKLGEENCAEGMPVAECEGPVPPAVAPENLAESA